MTDGDQRTCVCFASCHADVVHTAFAANVHRSSRSSHPLVATLVPVLMCHDGPRLIVVAEVPEVIQERATRSCQSFIACTCDQLRSSWLVEAEAMTLLVCVPVPIVEMVTVSEKPS